jgi:hypothetical protein
MHSVLIVATGLSDPTKNPFFPGLEIVLRPNSVPHDKKTRKEEAEFRVFLRRNGKTTRLLIWPRLLHKTSKETDEMSEITLITVYCFVDEFIKAVMNHPIERIGLDYLGRQAGAEETIESCQTDNLKHSASENLSPASSEHVPRLLPRSAKLRELPESDEPALCRVGGFYQISAVSDREGEGNKDVFHRFDGVKRVWAPLYQPPPGNAGICLAGEDE